MVLSAYRKYHDFHGDIHNHCNIGYGHGSVEDAFHNAQLQLDFTSVTAHARWPDLPTNEPRLADVVQYHLDGFSRAERGWPLLQEATEAANNPGAFASFLSFEWHSLAHGDHVVYYNGGEGPLLQAKSLESLRDELQTVRDFGIGCMLIPHHIGYQTGYRGLNWSDFCGTDSPVIEMFSMHGSAETGTSAHPYLHTMGPCDANNTVIHGLSRGLRFGMIGSTDHHSAHPGSYGHGRIAVWAEELTRESIWNAIKQRRTYALTGDRTRLMFSLNEKPMGSVVPEQSDRRIAVSVSGRSAVDYVEVIRNGRVIHRENGLVDAGRASDRFHLLAEVGWGVKDEPVDWNVTLRIDGGRLESIEPRFRGRDILEPQEGLKTQFAYSTIGAQSADTVAFSTRTWGNPATSTSGTQAVAATIATNGDATLTFSANNKNWTVPADQLLRGPTTRHLGGFLTPAVRLEQINPSCCECEFEISDDRKPTDADWYYVRVRHTNGQYAWSSPIWVSER